MKEIQLLDAHHTIDAHLSVEQICVKVYKVNSILRSVLVAIGIFYISNGRLQKEENVHYVFYKNIFNYCRWFYVRIKLYYF